MTSWIQGTYAHEQVKCDQVCKHNISCKQGLIKQDQLLKNYHNEHLARKYSSEHATQWRPITMINCMYKTQPMQNTRSICI